MALGIDIYRSFQKVTSYPGVKAAGVTFAWVKGTDGFGLAPGGPADNEVRGFQSVGIPVGLYHFSQPGSPEAQADVLLDEVTRLDATGVAAMLDMEDNPAGRGANIPPGLKRGWVTRFTNRARARGFTPCVYLNDSDAKAIRPDTIADDLVIVIARYGGKPRYGGRYDVHQFSSSGTIAGITARGVDLDESYTDNHLGAVIMRTESIPDDAIQQEDNVMLVPPGIDDHVNLIVKGMHELFVGCSWNRHVEIHYLYFYGPTGDDPNGTGVGGEIVDAIIDPNRSGPLRIPEGAVSATLRYTADHNFTVGTS